MNEELKKFIDDTNEALDERISNLIKYLVEKRTGFEVEINEVITFHYSENSKKLKTRSLAVSHDFCYCIETTYNQDTEKLMMYNFIFALRRGNKDFEVDIETKGNGSSIIPKVGPLQISEFKPIRTQRGDEWNAEELSEKLVQIVRHGRKIKRNPLTDEPLNAEEDIYVDLIIKIRRFASDFQKRIMDFVPDKSKSEKARFLETCLASTYGRKQGQIEFSIHELCEIVGSQTFSTLITDEKKLRYFAYQKLDLVKDLTKLSKIQEKMVKSHMPVSEKIREECFNCIKRTNVKMYHFDDSFKEIFDNVF